MFAFLVDGVRYALPVEEVLGVAEAAAGQGEVEFRGQRVPVEEAAPLGLGRPGAGRARGAGTVLVIRAPEGMRAVRVDAVSGIVGEVEARPWPALVASIPGPGFPGLAIVGGGALVIVDARALGARGGAAESGAPEGARGTS